MTDGEIMALWHKRWNQTFLTDRTQQVLVEGATSDSIPTSGNGTRTVAVFIIQTVSNQKHGCLLTTVTCIEGLKANRTATSYRMT